MKFILSLAIFFSLNAFAEQTYTFECNENGDLDMGYENTVTIRVPKSEFNSSKGQITATYEYLNYAGPSDQGTNATITGRSLTRTDFSLNVSLGRSGSVQMGGNFITGKGTITASTMLYSVSNAPAYCRFYDGSGISR